MVPVLHLEYNNFQAAPSTWYAASHTNNSNWYLNHISMQVRDEVHPPLLRSLQDSWKAALSKRPYQFWQESL
jgi:hypothetical protein